MPPGDDLSPAGGPRVELLQRAVDEFEELSERFSAMQEHVRALEQLNLALHHRLERRPHRAAEWILRIGRR